MTGAEGVILDALLEGLSPDDDPYKIASSFLERATGYSICPVGIQKLAHNGRVIYHYAIAPEEGFALRGPLLDIQVNNPSSSIVTLTVQKHVVDPIYTGCPSCGAGAGQPCVTKGGGQARECHVGRIQ